MSSRVSSAAGRTVLCLVALCFGTHAAPLHAAKAGWIDIESIPVEDYMRPQEIQMLLARSKLSEADEAIRKINRTRFKIVTPAGSGPYPAVFYLHTCDGIISSHYASWEPRFLLRGYAVVTVDSMVPRGVVSVCDTGNLFFPALRIGDAYAALFHLSANREKYRIDPRRVILVGYSNGGGVALYGMRTVVGHLLARKHTETARFAGSVAFYPLCAKGNRPSFYNPVVVLIGKDDDWTPAERCASWAELSPPARSAAFEVHVFPDTTHSFDVPSTMGGVRYGRHFLQYSPAATAKSEEIIEAFMRKIDVALAAKQAAADQLRRTLTGNTLQLTLRNGRTGIQYFDPDGRAPLVVVGARQFPDLRWRVDDDGRLCRELPQNGREECVEAIVEQDEVTLYGPGSTEGQRAALLLGDQRPQGGAQKPSNAGIERREADR